MYLLIIAVAVMLLPGKARAQCPWINKVTVAAIYGIRNDSQAISTTETNTSCLFQFQGKRERFRLFVDIQRAAEYQPLVAALSKGCASKGELLRGIGNEAFVCQGRVLSRYSSEVIGRVRNSVFMVQSAAFTKNSGLGEGGPRQQAVIAAQQVAGNLF